MKPISKRVFYTLEGKNESEISPIWKVLQVCFYASCMLLGFVITYYFNRIIRMTKHHCVLYADLQVTNKTFSLVRGQLVSCSVEILQSQYAWNHCDVILSIAVVSIIMSSFFLVMFLYCGRGGAGTPWMPDAWRIVWPTIITNGFNCFLVVFSVIDYTKGLMIFRGNLDREWQFNQTPVTLDEMECLEVEGTGIGEDLGKGLLLLMEALFLWMSFWSLNLFWILSRCAFNIDFQLVRTTICEYPRPRSMPRRPVVFYPAEERPRSPGEPETKHVKFRPLQTSDFIREKSKSPKQRKNIKK